MRALTRLPELPEFQRTGLVLLGIGLMIGAVGIHAQPAAFDITAKSEAGADTNADAVRQRLKALLADRFRLKTHPEMREMTVSALVLAEKTGKLGRDLKPTTAACGGAASETCRTFMTGQRDANGRLQMLFRGVGGRRASGRIRRHAGGDPESDYRRQSGDDLGIAAAPWAEARNSKGVRAGGRD